MKLLEILLRGGNKKNPLLGLSSSLYSQLEKDRFLYGVFYIQLTNPNLIVRLLRFLSKKPIYIKRLDPRNIRKGVSTEIYSKIF